MAAISSGVNLSATYYLRDFYKNDQTAFKTSNRKELSKNKLSNEDSLALRRAVKALGHYEYKEDEIESKLLGSVDAFTKTYNNMLDSANKGDKSTMQRFAKQLKSLSSKYSSELDDIGIKINSDGSLKLNETLFKKSDASEIQKVFGKDSGFTKQLASISKRMASTSSEALYAEMTGSGQNVDLTL